MHPLLFFHLENQFSDTTKINQILFAEFPTKEDDPTGELLGIISLIILHSPYENENHNALYIKRSTYSSPE